MFAEQQANGAYFPVRQPITEDDVAEHLAGMASYGTYVIDPATQTVKYLCFDLDTHDEAATAHLVECVEAMVEAVGGDKRCLLLEWSGNKGVHVWLFLSEPVEARKVRRWVQRDFMPAWEEKAKPGHFPLEVFPKQDTVPENGYGNLVKLPLGKHAVSGNFSKILGCGAWAESVEEVQPLDSNLIPSVPDSDLSQTRSAGSIARRDRAEGDGPSSPFACVDFIKNEGVGKGVRDLAMYHLALYYYGHGIDEDIAADLCLRANENFDPPLSEQEVRSKVTSAYTGRYVSARCGSDWLADICPGPCNTGWSVRKVEGSTLARATEGSVVEVEISRVVREEGRSRVTVYHPDADNQPTFLVRQ